MKKSIQLLLLPGLGADGRLAKRQRNLPYSVVCPDYIAWRSGESLADYSERFLKQLIDQGAIDPHLPLYLGGASMGGAIAQEMSRHIQAKGVILIGSLRSERELRGGVRWIARHITPWLPLWMYKVGALFIPLVMKVVSGVTAEDIRMSKAMYLSLPKGLFREGCRAISEWTGCHTPTALFRIHGTEDHIIPFRASTDINVVISGGRHLIGLSHWEIVNSAIEEFVERTYDKR